MLEHKPHVSVVGDTDKEFFGHLAELEQRNFRERLRCTGCLVTRLLDQSKEILNRNLFVSTHFELLAQRVINRLLDGSRHISMMDRSEIGIFEQKFTLDAASKSALGHVVYQVKRVFAENKVSVEDGELWVGSKRHLLSLFALLNP